MRLWCVFRDVGTGILAPIDESPPLLLVSRTVQIFWICWLKRPTRTRPIEAGKCPGDLPERLRRLLKYRTYQLCLMYFNIIYVHTNYYISFVLYHFFFTSLYPS